jgi:hypothetical protein
MAAQTGAGIQELMAAETRASQIVAEARMGMCGALQTSLIFCRARECTNFALTYFLLLTIDYRPWGPHEAGQGGCSRFD